MHEATDEGDVQATTTIIPKNNHWSQSRKSGTTLARVRMNASREVNCLNAHAKRHLHKCKQVGVCVALYVSYERNVVARLCMVALVFRLLIKCHCYRIGDALSSKVSDTQQSPTGAKSVCTRSYLYFMQILYGDKRKTGERGKLVIK